MLRAIAEGLGPFWQGDTPSAVFAVEFVNADRDVMELPEGTISAVLLDPSSAPTPVPLEVTVANEHQLVIAWGEVGALSPGGTWRVVFRAQGVRISVLRFVVQTDNGWLSLEDARQGWADAPTDDAMLSDMLESARVACVNYAPLLGVGANPPVQYRVAQLMQARAVWNSVKADANVDSFGAEGFTVRVYPLDTTVRQQLRPRAGRPIVR